MGTGLEQKAVDSSVPAAGAQRVSGCTGRAGLAQPNSVRAPSRRGTYSQLATFALLVCAGIAAVEAVHTVRILTTSAAPRHFPQDYVSKGVWAAYAYIRPLDATSDDIEPTLGAAAKMLHGDPALYASFEHKGLGFIYPPSAPVVLLPVTWATNEALPHGVRMVDLLGRACTCAIVLIALYFLRGQVRGLRTWNLVLVMLLAFFPLRWALCCVNAQTLISFCLAGAVMAYARSNGVLCGVLIGLAACMKPCTFPVLLFAVVRGEWRVVIAALVTAGLLVATSVLLVGADPWVTYGRDVFPLVSGGYTFWGNQSAHALARRWVGDPQIWEFTVPSASVTYFSACAFVVLLACASWPRGRSAAAGWHADPPPQGGRLVSNLDLFRAGDLGIALTLLTMASPIAWDHYYGWTIVLFCVCLAAGPRLAASRVYFVLLGVSYVALATNWIPLTSGRSGPITLLDSPKLFAAALLSGITWHACRRLHSATRNVSVASRSQRRTSMARAACIGSRGLRDGTTTEAGPRTRRCRAS